MTQAKSDLIAEMRKWSNTQPDDGARLPICRWIADVEALPEPDERAFDTAFRAAGMLWIEASRIADGQAKRAMLSAADILEKP